MSNTTWKTFSHPSHNAHNRIKYANLCYKSIHQSIPKKSYTFLPPRIYRPKMRYYTKSCWNSHPPNKTCIREMFSSSVFISDYNDNKCASCGATVQYSLDHPHNLIEHPQSRNRVTLLCDECAEQTK